MYILELVGEDDQFAVCEAENAAVNASVAAPGIGIAVMIHSSRITKLAYTRHVNHLIGRTDATLRSAERLVTAMSTSRSGSAAARVRDVRGTTGIDTRRGERSLGAILVEHGFTIDLDRPDHELRVLFSGSDCFVGWHLTETERGFGDRAPTERPFFQPGSMAPIEARAIANFARAGPGLTVLDPMCGTGGLLIEAGLLGAEVIGVDIQEKMTVGATRNLRQYLTSGFNVLQGDAGYLPFCEQVDILVFDAPYGRQSKIAGRDREEVVSNALSEARRISDRCVLIGDQPWNDAAVDAGWHVEKQFERRVHRSLTRYIHLLTKHGR